MSCQCMREPDPGCCEDSKCPLSSGHCRCCDDCTQHVATSLPAPSPVGSSVPGNTPAERQFSIEDRMVEAGRQAVKEMAFDWYCPINRTVPRYACRECVAEVAVRAALVVQAEDAAWLRDATGRVTAEINRLRAALTEGDSR